MTNADLLEETYQTALGSEGSATKELGNWQQGLQYSVDTFKASLEELSTTALSSDLAKGFVDFGTDAVNAINDVISSIGGLGTALAALGGVAFFKNMNNFKQIGLLGDAFTQASEVLRTGNVVPDLAKIITGSGFNAKQINSLFKTTGISSELANEVLNYADLGQSEEFLNEATRGLSASMSSGTAAVSGMGLAFQGLKAQISAVGSAMASSFLANPAMYAAVAAAIVAVGTGIGIVISRMHEFDNAADAANSAMTDWQDSQSELDSINSQIDDVKSQLETIAGEYDISLVGHTDSVEDMINTLESSGELSLDDQATVESLRTQNAELEHQQALQERIVEADHARAKEAADELLALQDTADLAQGMNYGGETIYGNTDILKATRDEIDEMQRLTDERRKAIEENPAVDTSQTDARLAELDEAVSDQLTTLGTIKDGVDDQTYNTIQGLERDYSNLNLSDVEREVANINDLFSDTSMSGVQDALVSAVEAGGSASDAFERMGFSLDDAGISAQALNGYIQEIADSASEASDEIDSVEGTVESMQDAADSADADENWKNASSLLSDANDLFEEGKVGIDDFKTAAQYMSHDVIDPDAEGFKLDADAYAAAWTDAQDKVTRYFDSENPLQSAQNTVDDLVDAGLAVSKGDGLFDWTSQFQNTAQAADALDLSIAATEDLMHNLESYGAEFADVVFSGEGLEQYRSSLDGIKSLYDSMSEGETKDMLSAEIQGWEEAYSKYEGDLTSLDEEAIVHIQFEYDMAKLKADVEEARNADENVGGSVSTKGTVLANQQNLIDAQKAAAGLNAEGGVEIPIITDIDAQIDQAYDKLANASDDTGKKLAQSELINLKDMESNLLDFFNNSDYAVGIDENSTKEEVEQAWGDAAGDLEAYKSTMEVDADTSEAEQDIDNVKNQQGSTNIDVKLNDEDAKNKLESLINNNTETGTVTFDADINGAEAEITAFRGDVGEPLVYTVEGDASVDEAKEAISEITGQDKKSINVALNASGNAVEEIEEAESEAEAFDGTEEDTTLGADNSEVSEDISEAEAEGESFAGQNYEANASINYQDNGSANQAAAAASSTTTEQTISVKYEPDTSALASATSGLDTTATITYTADTAAVAGMVSSLLQQHGTVTYTANTAMLPTTFQSGTAIVNYTANTASLPTSFPNVQRTVDYIADTSALPTSFPNVSRTVNYTANTAGLPTSFSTITRTVHYQATGDTGGAQQINGTAHANGTTKGYSYASGNLDDSSWIKSSWETNRGEVALTGEIGQELVVDPYTNKWFTVGDEGAEFAYIPKGAVVFNAEQTKELFENGFTDSYGYSYLTGTAHKDTYNGVRLKSSSSSSSSKSTSSSKTSSSTSSKSSGGSSSKKNSGTSKKSGKTKTKTALEKFQDWFSKLFDWIEIKLERQTDKISRYITKAENALNEGSYGTSAKNYVNAIASTSTQIGYEDTAYSKYMKEANKTLKKGQSTGAITSKQAKKIRTRVKNGTMNISEYSDKQQEVIKDYMEWWFFCLFIQRWVNENLSNCWEALKLYTLQRKNEINLSVTVVKTEKSI